MRAGENCDYDVAAQDCNRPDDSSRVIMNMKQFKDNFEDGLYSVDPNENNYLLIMKGSCYSMESSGGFSSLTQNEILSGLGTHFYSKITFRQVTFQRPLK